MADAVTDEPVAWRFCKRGGHLWQFDGDRPVGDEWDVVQPLYSALHSGSNECRLAEQAHAAVHQAATAAPAPAPASERDMAAFGASEASAYYAPGQDQGPLRRAFEDGAAFAHTGKLPSAPAVAPHGGDLRAALPKPTREWAYDFATKRQGQSDTPRCEEPSEYDINTAYQFITWAIETAPFLASSPEPDVLPGLSQAERDVLAERRRQVEAEGWTPDRDDEHSEGQIGRAALNYLAAACLTIALGGEDFGGAPPLDDVGYAIGWPWGRRWWKPSSVRRMLVKAGALIVVEVDRWDRAEIARREGGER